MGTADNVAGFGLQLTHLKKKIFQRDGDDELLNTVISQNSEEQSRVTNVKSTLESVIQKLVNLFCGWRNLLFFFILE